MDINGNLGHFKLTKIKENIVPKILRTSLTDEIGVLWSEFNYPTII